MKAYLSGICKGAVSASTVHVNGICKGKTIKKIKGEVSSQFQYINLIGSYIDGLKVLRSVVENDKTVNEVIIETNNSSFRTWLDRGYALPQYTDIFMELMELLNDIPVKYEIIYNKELKAKMYAKESYVPKERLSGID